MYNVFTEIMDIRGRLGVNDNIRIFLIILIFSNTFFVLPVSAQSGYQYDEIISEGATFEWIVNQFNASIGNGLPIGNLINLSKNDIIVIDILENPPFFEYSIDTTFFSLQINDENSDSFTNALLISFLVVPTKYVSPDTVYNVLDEPILPNGFIGEKIGSEYVCVDHQQITSTNYTDYTRTMTYDYETGLLLEFHSEATNSSGTFENVNINMLAIEEELHNELYRHPLLWIIAITVVLVVFYLIYRHRYHQSDVESNDEKSENEDSETVSSENDSQIIQ